LATTNIAVPGSKNRLLALALLLFGLPVLLGVTFYLFPGFYVTRAQRYRMWRMGLQSQTVTLSGYSIHYLVAGEGKPVVMIHGLGGRAEDWLALIPALTRSGYKVYAPDLLGFGRSARPDVDYSISLQTNMIRQFMDSQKVQQAVVV
jgi:alpha-beta hydrolase superfamily lysophospholipase